MLLLCGELGVFCNVDTNLSVRKYEIVRKKIEFGGGIFMKIMMKKLLSSSLNSVFSVEQLFDEIKKTEDENIILDFSGIQFVALSFAQAYVASKKQCEKNITELNVSDENKITLNIPAQS